MPDAPEYLFVYGTLRPTFNNPFAGHLRRLGLYIGEGTFPGRLYDLGSYPGAVYLDNHTSYVLGAVYDISAHQHAVLTFLDEYEGIGDDLTQPDEYVRAVIPVHCHGRLLHCWVYLYNLDPVNEIVIKSGDYERYSRHK